ncbi:MAG: hypothetical protein COA78_37105 [Blastopirellula sp.]|nr:MAG: hypothetical protein COA78_37105 [Blastopirellula sp.]
MFHKLQSYQLLLMLGLLLASSGCSLSNNYLKKDPTMLRAVPHKSVLEPRCAPDYVANPYYHGYYETCWKTWPEDWNPCPHRDPYCVGQEYYYEEEVVEPQPAVDDSAFYGNVEIPLYSSAPPEPMQQTQYYEMQEQVPYPVYAIE